jgi:hypothetical protein
VGGGEAHHCYNLLRSNVESVVRQEPAKRGPVPWNEETEGATALRVVTRQRPVKTQQTKKT